MPYLDTNKEWVFILESFELAFEKEELNRIKKMWNSGKKLIEIVEVEKREPVEIILALIHMAYYGHKMRPFHKLL